MSQQNASRGQPQPAEIDPEALEIATGKPATPDKGLLRSLARLALSVAARDLAEREGQNRQSNPGDSAD